MSFSWVLDALITFVVVFLLVRLVGKRAVAQMSVFDMTVIMVSGSFFAQALKGAMPWAQAIVTGASFYAIYYAFTLLLLNNKVRNLLNDKPTVLISNNKIRETGLREVRMTIPELLGELRLKGYKSLADVEFAIMEEEGKVSIIPKSEKEKVTVGDLHLQKAVASLAVPVVIAGEVIEENLHFLNRDQNWLAEQLAKHHLTLDDIPDLSVVQVEPDGKVTVDRDEPAMKGIWRDEYKTGQYASRPQAETAIMPPYHGYPGVADPTKQALDQAEQVSPASQSPSSPVSPTIGQPQLQQLQATLSQLQQQQAEQQQLLQDILTLMQSTPTRPATPASPH